ncbi:hypothetical protein OIU84_025987 [Salix udensis]|uniref:Uncharacterized protein n=1 Tax=Salix udensis TaxID=889485 RepID=A0AAD6PE98_9ROSI|nr:hypothetical protein OIU84_025987 [Salix udensis]
MSQIGQEHAMPFHCSELFLLMPTWEDIGQSLGMTLLTLSASIHGLKPSYDRTNVFHTAGSGTSVFFLGLYLLALEIGGIKPLVETLSFGDQPHQIEAYPSRFSFFGKAAVEIPSDRLKETPFRDCHRFEH